MGEELDLDDCIVDPDVRTSHWRCAACRAELVPGSLDPEEVADMLLRGERKPVPHCPRTFTDGRVVVWAPNFALRGGGWSYRLYPRVAAKLAEAEHGWVATRHGNGATVFYDWREFSLLLPCRPTSAAGHRTRRGPRTDARLPNSKGYSGVTKWTRATTGPLRSL